MAIVLSRHGHTFATRSRARAVLDAEANSLTGSSITIDASDVSMSPSFIAELLVALVKEGRCDRVFVRGARERPAHITQDLASKFGFADRVRVEQPAVSAG